MRLIANSVWQSTNVLGAETGLWRLLKVYPLERYVILKDLNGRDNAVQKPSVLDLVFFQDQVESLNLRESKFELPAWQLFDDKDLPEKHILVRDMRFNAIQEAVRNEYFLYQFATEAKCRLVSEYAERACVSALNLKKWLNLFWTYGLQKNALLPKFSNCGAAGVDRVPNPKKDKRLAVKMRTAAFSAKKGVFVSESDKEIFIKYLKKHYLKSEPKSLGAIYRDLKEGPYEHSVNIPSKTQFYYWARKLVSAREQLSYQTTEQQKKLQYRPILGSATQYAPVPGSAFEIDGTLLDVHLVSKLNRKRSIGRPIVVILIDKASRMIVGLYVGLEGEGWQAASQAILNAMLPKAEYCKRYGIIISDDDWPCAHVPKTLVCDRGALIYNKAKSTLSSFMNIEYTPSLRPDLKGNTPNK